MIMKHLLLLFVLAALPPDAAAGDFCRGWLFWSDRDTVKTVVDIPHDAMQTEIRSARVPGGHNSGCFPGGVYHYEKILDVTAKMLRQHVTVDFEGVWQKAKVYVNGVEAGGTVYGYTPFSVCLDGKLRKGGNVIRVDADNSQVPCSRWYTGAGIYRPVHLNVQESTHIEDVCVRTLSVSPATVSVKVGHTGGEVEVRILDDGLTVASAAGSDVVLTVPDAALWSAEHPHLYQVEVTLKKKGRAVERQVRDFGIRTLSWSPEGFFVNGESVLLRGGCIHHDNGLLGACEYDDAAFRRIRILKEYGFNAVRSAHNPCSEAVLRACDRLGMYVMDELWDVWYDHKNPYDYASDFRDNYVEDIDAFVRKDFNHPSVVMYSIANEPTEPAGEDGVRLARDIVGRLHALDDSRPVTAGINMAILYMNSLGISLAGAASERDAQKMTSEQYNTMMTTAGERLMQAVLRPEVDSVSSPVLDVLDIAGYNYGNRRYERDAADHPRRIVVGTETYAYSLGENWALVGRLPYLIGDFMWTAWDYIGEAGIGAWYHSDEPPSMTKEYPWLLAGSGALDLLGHPTGEALRAKAVWLRDGKPYIGVRPIHHERLVKASWRGTDAIPSWSWRGCDGMPATVEVFTSAPLVRLYLDGEPLGEREVVGNVATFDVEYRGGTLKAVAVDDDGGIQTAELKSSCGALQITCTPERAAYREGELIFIDIDITDRNGVVESNADRELSINAEGAQMLGFGSAAPRTEDRFRDGRYTTFYGRCQAVLKASAPGIVRLTVSGPGLDTALCEIPVTSPQTP